MGEVVGLIGFNGVGKLLFIDVFIGVIKNCGGMVWFDGGFFDCFLLYVVVWCGLVCIF